MTVVGNSIADESQRLVPVDKGDLKGSVFVVPVPAGGESVERGCSSSRRRLSVWSCTAEVARSRRDATDQYQVSPWPKICVDARLTIWKPPLFGPPRQW